MPLSGPTFNSSLWGIASGKIPTANTASRTNAAMGIPPHNPFMVIVQSTGTAWLSTIMKPGIVVDVYTGVTGVAATQVSPMPVVLPAAVAAATTFQASMGWVGAAGTLVAGILTTDLFTLTQSTGMIQMNPLPGGATGAGVVNPATLAALGPAFTAELNYQLQKYGWFSPLDSKVGLTPEIALLVTNLSIAFTTAIGSLVATIPYVGAPLPATPPAPFASAGTGSIV